MESVVVGPVLVGFLANDVVVAIEMHLHLAAVVALDLNLKDAAGAEPLISVISLNVGDG